MKRLLIILVFITSCSNNDVFIEEDMRMFISSPNTQPEDTAFVLPPNSVRVLIKGGQSNSVGSALNSDATSGELDQSTSVKIYNTSYVQKWRFMQVGFSNYGNTSSHGSELGLDVAFQDTFPGETLYIIKWGASGTNITQHLQGGVNYNSVWDARVVAGIQELLDLGLRVFVYVSWLQGEHDSLTPTNRDLYATRFPQLVSEHEETLGVGVPWLNTTIIETDADDVVINDVFRNESIVRDNMTTFEANGANHIGDNLHYNYTEQKNIANAEIDFMLNYTPIEVTSISGGL